MAELVKLRTTRCGKTIVVAEIGEKAAELRRGSIIFEKVATFGPLYFNLLPRHRQILPKFTLLINLILN
jgi:hypothetical protein